MRPSIRAIFSIPLLISQLTNAYTFSCDHIRVDKKSFDLSKLSGPHSVLVHDEDRPPLYYNTTWTLDICAPLAKEKNIKDQYQCTSGTRVCGIETAWDPVKDPDQENVLIEKVIPVAGSLQGPGTHLDPKITRLKSTDSQKDGLLVELSGGLWDKRKQKAIIEFQCDKERTGNEGSEKSPAIVEKRADDKDDDEDDNPNSLTFVSYGSVEGKQEMDILRLNWRTKYACEDFEGDDDDDNVNKSAGWGFFTWFVLILFLGTAAYLIFGSWLNYNRYGARGWDLLPHGDTIRDMPYIFKDWSKKVVDSVSGGGSRGGYSAV